MKKIIGALIVFASLTAGADEWPYDSTCRRYGATSETVTVEGQEDSPIVLCEFGMSAYIEKETLRRSSGGYGNSAVRAYRESANDPFGTHCGMAGASIVTANDSKGRTYWLCVFFDDSIMEERTFSRGPKDMFNREMNRALGLPWLFNL